MNGCRMKEFLMKWKGLEDEKTSWEKDDGLSEFKELIKPFGVIKSIRTSID